MPRLDKDIVVRRVEASHLARVWSAIERLDELLDDAGVLNAFARGEIDRAEDGLDFRGWREHK